jgi:hypothetical protein
MASVPYAAGAKAACLRIAEMVRWSEHVAIVPVRSLGDEHSQRRCHSRFGRSGYS